MRSAYGAPWEAPHRFQRCPHGVATSAPRPGMSATSVTTEAAWNAERTRAAATPPRIVPVLVRGSQRTYALRERLRAAGLRWEKEARVWSGQVPDYFLPQMRAEGLPVIPVVPEGDPLDRFAERGSPVPSAAPKTPVRKLRAHPRKEPPVRVSAEERAEAFLAEHGWTLQDITANLADDAREADERRVERYLRDLRSRVKAVRALISADPTIRQTLATNPEKAAAFYAIHGVTEAQVRHGVPDMDVRGLEWDDLVSMLRGALPGNPVSVDWQEEEAQRSVAILPGSEG